MRATAALFLGLLLSAAGESPAAVLEISASALDVTRSSLPVGPDKAEWPLDLLAGERPRVEVRLHEGAKPADAGDAVLLATNVEVLVLPADHGLEIHGLTGAPFAQRLALARSASIARLEAETTIPSAEASIVFGQRSGETLPPGEYDIVVLASPDGFEARLAPQHDDVNGLVLDGVEFRVLDAELDANRNYALFRRAQQAADADRLEDAEALADALVARCPASGVATAVRAEIRAWRGEATGADWQLALRQLDAGASVCDSAVVPGTSHADDLRRYWTSRAGQF